MHEFVLYFFGHIGRFIGNIIYVHVHTCLVYNHVYNLYLQASMTRLSQCVLSIMELPRHLVPQLGLE